MVLKIIRFNCIIWRNQIPEENNKKREKASASSKTIDIALLSQKESMQGHSQLLNHQNVTYPSLYRQTE
jgi:hypothetical protein